MKKILYYVSDHGKGHATRSIAIIQEMLKHNIEVNVRNTNALEFFKQSLPNVKIIPGKTDVGSTIKKDGFSIDKRVVPGGVFRIRSNKIVCQDDSNW